MLLFDWKLTNDSVDSQMILQRCVVNALSKVLRMISAIETKLLSSAKKTTLENTQTKRLTRRQHNTQKIAQTSVLLTC